MSDIEPPGPATPGQPGPAWWRLPLALTWIAAVLFAGSHLPSMRLDNSYRIWELKGGLGDPREPRYRAEFGDNDYLILAYDAAGDVTSVTEMEHLRQLHRRIESLGIPVQVYSLWSYFRDSRGYGEDEIIEPADIDSLAEEIQASPFFHGQLVHPGNRALALHLEVVDLSPPALRTLKQALDRLVAEELAKGTTLYWGGIPSISMVLDEISMGEMRTHFPIGILLGSLVGWGVGLPLRALLALLVVAASAVAATLGAIVFAGHPMNLILGVLPSMVFFMTLVYGVHVVHALQAPRRSAVRERALRATFRPLLDACATSSIGLLSLCAADFTILDTLGRFGAMGLFTGMLGVYLVVPVLLGPVGACAREALRMRDLPRPRAHIAFWFLVTLITLPALPRIETRMDPLGFLPAEHPLPTSYRWIEKNLTGLAPFDLVLETEEPQGSLEWMRTLDRLSAEIAVLPDVTFVVGVGDLVKRLHQNTRAGERIAAADYRLPDDPAELARTMEASGRIGDLRRRFVSADRRTWRLHVRSTARLGPVFEKLSALVRERAAALIPGARIGLHGAHVRIKRIESYLLSSQIRSLILSWLLVSIILVLRAPTRRIGVLAIPPNTIPILLVLAFMGYAGMPLDIATIMVTTLAAGLAVDDTFHYLASYAGWRARGLGNAGAVRAALAHTGPAVAQSALFMTSLFLTLSVSTFTPIARFGMLSAAGVLTALLVEHSLIPALLLTFVPESDGGPEGAGGAEACGAERGQEPCEEAHSQDQ